MSQSVPTDSELAIKKTEQREFLKLVLSTHELLLDRLDYHEVDRLQDDEIEKKLYLLGEIEKLIDEKKITEDPNVKMVLSEAILDEVTGFGPIQRLLRDETVTDIFINAPDKIYVERRGRVEKTPVCFLDDNHILRLVQRVASKSGRHLDLGTPYFDSQLPDGSRIHAIIPPIAIDHIKVSVRKYNFQKLTIDTLVEGGALTPEMAELLQIAVKSRFNIAICGGTGSGKTTLLNSLLVAIRQGERIITIEDTPELESSHHHTVRLLTRVPNAEGRGAVTQADLMINALRMRPDRVILGELRGAEAFNLLHAMNTGQDGSMVTLHANGAEEVITRLLNMILMARYSLSVESVRQQIAGALDLVVYVCRLVDGSRKIMSISQVGEDETGDLKIDTLFNYKIDKINPDELVGEFVHFDVPPTERIRTKLITAGLEKEYLAVLSASRSGSQEQKPKEKTPSDKVVAEIAEMLKGENHE